MAGLQAAAARSTISEPGSFGGVTPPANEGSRTSDARIWSSRPRRSMRPVTRMMLSIPEATASSTPYWMIGLSTSGSISFG